MESLGANSGSQLREWQWKAAAKLLATKAAVSVTGKMAIADFPFGNLRERHSCLAGRAPAALAQAVGIETAGILGGPSAARAGDRSGHGDGGRNAPTLRPVTCHVKPSRGLPLDGRILPVVPADADHGKTDGLRLVVIEMPVEPADFLPHSAGRLGDSNE